MSRPAGALKIKARSVPDIMTLSGFIQDALIAPNEMTVESDKRRYVAILNRFMWERVGADQSIDMAPPPATEDEDARFEDASDGKFWRVQAALVIERANVIKRKNLETSQNPGTLSGKDFYSLLSMVPDEKGVTLFFAGGGMIRAEGPALEVFLEDLSEPWPTPQMPVHKDDEPSAG